MILKKHRIFRSFVQAHPDWVFVFGDNMKRRGFGGQAKEMRGEPNVIGIPTKWYPGTAFDAYFRDEHIAEFWPTIQARLEEILEHLKASKTVVIPSSGIGTGLSKMYQTAPNAYMKMLKVFELYDKWYWQRDIRHEGS